MKKILYLLMLVSVTACTTPIPTTYVEPFIQDNKLVGSFVAGAGWKLSDGLIEALPTEDMTYLKSEQQFENFILTAEFFPVGNVNSGIFIRCQPDKDLSPVNCYEINIWDDHPNQDSRTGAIVTRELPLEKVSTVGQWNSCEIIADSTSVTVKINGVVTVVHEGNALKSGFIALQRANAETVRFRNVRVESLD